MADALEKAIDPKLRPAFTLFAAIVTGVVLVLVGVAKFDERTRRLAREEWASDAQAAAADRAQHGRDIAALQARVSVLERQFDDLNLEIQIQKARGSGRRERP